MKTVSCKRFQVKPSKLSKHFLWRRQKYKKRNVLSIAPFHPFCLWQCNQTLSGAWYNDGNRINDLSHTPLNYDLPYTGRVVIHRALNLQSFLFILQGLAFFIKIVIYKS